MSGAATEQVVSDVHDYLTTLGEDLRAGKVDLEDLIINKVSCCFSGRRSAMS